MEPAAIIGTIFFIIMVIAIIWTIRKVLKFWSEINNEIKQDHEEMRRNRWRNN